MSGQLPSEQQQRSSGGVKCRSEEPASESSPARVDRQRRQPPARGVTSIGPSPGQLPSTSNKPYPYTTSSTPPQSLSYPASKPPSTTASSLRANLLETGESNSSSRTTKGPTTVPWYSVRTSSSLSAQAPSPSPPAKWVSASPLQSIRMIPSSAQRPS